MSSRAFPRSLTCLVVGDIPERDLRRAEAAAPDVDFQALSRSDHTARARAEVLLVWDFRWFGLLKLLPELPRLRWIHAASAGVDHVLLPELAERGIALSNASGVFERPIAEYVLALVLAHAKGLVASSQAQVQRRWAYRETAGIEGALMVVLGAGRIGRALAALATAAGLRVIGVRRQAAPAEAGLERIVGVASLPAVLPAADYLVLTLAATPETRHLIDRGVIGLLPPTAYLINVARGTVLDSEALVEALRSGRLAGAALDVFDDEPLPPESPLWTAPNLLVSPHMAGDTYGWTTRVVDHFLANLERFRAGAPLSSPVDPRRGY